MKQKVNKSTQEVEVYRVTDEEVQIRVRRSFPIKRIISLLLEGEEIFMPIDRKAASYIRKKVENEIGELIEAYPAIYKDMEGYVFKISLVREVLFGGKNDAKGKNQEKN